MIVNNVIAVVILHLVVAAGTVLIYYLCWFCCLYGELHLVWRVGESKVKIAHSHIVTMRW